jgi:hypothetical protein
VIKATVANSNDRRSDVPNQVSLVIEVDESAVAPHAKPGTGQAITATAHKIARVLYHVLLTKELYAETVFHQSDEHAQRRA